MNEPFVLGLDIGTTSAKAVIFSENGYVQAETEREYPVYTSPDGQAEQNPREVKNAAAAAVRAAISSLPENKRTVSGIGISAAMHSWMAVDETNRPLMNAIIWSDRRSSAIADEWHQSGYANTLYRQTGTPVHPMSPVVKTEWIRRENPGTFKEAAYWKSLKEYILFDWCGTADVDYSIASSSGLFDYKRHTWCNEALHACGLTEEQLGTPVSPLKNSYRLTTEAAGALGVSTAVPITIGASDGPLANLGLGAVNEEETAVTIGTSGAIRKMSREPVSFLKQRAFCYAFTDNLWITGGPSNNGANTLQWFLHLFTDPLIPGNGGKTASDIDTASFTHAAETIAPGADGLIFVPWIHGERAPIWDADARGGFSGLDSSHSMRHMLRAVLEGILLNLLAIEDEVQTEDPSKAIYASGGFARSPNWVQMLADISGKPVHLPLSHQSSAWGAAWLSLTVSGRAASLEDIRHHIPMNETVYPDKEKHEIYKHVMTDFRHACQKEQDRL
ncbi:gluconokinase [Salisediminibacterium halotolerans]|uniref:Gluconokinase n=1 Tax=Salisediminibacterium halotolerans TaxID=517425 RepID=A0A1H9WDP7_9BACI|nr:gluconokinase [Salisediminibacterium haloalkalitolerans]SES31975.1 gluconokinase [Salisediminibacterium haloalkalitolerans]